MDEKDIIGTVHTYYTTENIDSTLWLLGVPHSFYIKIKSHMMRKCLMTDMIISLSYTRGIFPFIYLRRSAPILVKFEYDCLCSFSLLTRKTKNGVLLQCTRIHIQYMLPYLQRKRGPSIWQSLTMMRHTRLSAGGTLPISSPL